VLGDLDRDGRTRSDPGQYRRTTPGLPQRRSPRGHWLGLRFLDPQHGSRDAIGTEFTVRAGTRSWWGMVQPSTSYMGSHDSAVTIGLGNLSSVDTIEVLWPDGSKQQFTGIPTDRWNTLYKGQGTRRQLPGKSASAPGKPNFSHDERFGWVVQILSGCLLLALLAGCSKLRPMRLLPQGAAPHPPLAPRPHPGSVHRGRPNTGRPIPAIGRCLGPAGAAVPRR